MVRAFSVSFISIPLQHLGLVHTTSARHNLPTAAEEESNCKSKAKPRTTIPSSGPSSFSPSATRPSVALMRRTSCCPYSGAGGVGAGTDVSLRRTSGRPAPALPLAAATASLTRTQSAASHAAPMITAIGARPKSLLPM